MPASNDLPPVLVRPAAEEEISEAFRWYEDRSEGLGSEFMRALDACLASVQRPKYAKISSAEALRRMWELVEKKNGKFIASVRRREH